MERKTKIEIGLAIAVLLLCVAFALMWRNRAVTPTVATIPAAQTINTAKDKPVSSASGSSATPEVATPVVKETSAITVARTFVERFGSYSSEADAENIDDVVPMATVAFQKKLNALAKESRASSAGTYYGVSTLVVTAPKTVSASATQTVLTMTTQREETNGDPSNTTKKYQSITVTLVKSGTTWLIDGYTWKDGV